MGTHTFPPFLTSHTRSMLHKEAIPEGCSVMKQGMLSPGCITPCSGAIRNAWGKQNLVLCPVPLLHALALQEIQSGEISLPVPFRNVGGMRGMQLLYSRSDCRLCWWMEP